MVIMLSIHPSRFSDIVGTERIVAEPDVPIGFYRDSFGNVCGRLVAPAGGVTLRGDALVRDSGLPDVVVPTAQQLPIDQLPDEVLHYLMPSRYCETDKLTDIAWSLFGNTPPGWARVQAIVDFVHNHVTFGYQHAHHMKSAHDVYEQRAGVCRDFAHLALTLCRCMNIPARYCTGYLGDIGVPRDPAPMDFSGWFQVYLSGQWYTFDARHNVPRIGRILMGTGRDAADVALTTSFGRMDLVKFFVISDEVVPAYGAPRHCERTRSNPSSAMRRDGLLRCARNDIESHDFRSSLRLRHADARLRPSDGAAAVAQRGLSWAAPPAAAGSISSSIIRGWCCRTIPRDIVFGELYRLRDRDALLGEFDMYEACGAGFPEPTEYIRRRCCP